MDNRHDDAFLHDDQILPETLEEWKEKNMLPDDITITPDEADVFFTQHDAGEQIRAVMDENHRGTEFDKYGTERARKYFEEKRKK